MDRFSFFVPTRVEFGEGVSKALPQEASLLGARKVLVVADSGLIKLGIAEPFINSLIEAGFDVEVFSEIESNPTDITCNRGGEKARVFGADCIVGIGGGSSLDTAKVISMLVTNDGNVGDYYGYDRMEREGIPVITIPTTAGTGSEITIWAVITNTGKHPHVKDSVGSNLICPKVALVDPALTYGLPPFLTASTGMDALCHAIEGYTSLPANPYTDMYAERAIRLVSGNLLQAYAYGANVKARRNMMLAQLFGGIAFSNADTHANHALAEALGGIYNIPHGVANAVFLPHVMRYIAISDPCRHKRIAELLGCNTDGIAAIDASERAVSAVSNLSARLNIPHLKDIGVREDDFSVIADIAMKNLGTPDSPRTMTKDGFVEILYSAWDCAKL
jgi:alcohol dehydrogenase